MVAHIFDVKNKTRRAKLCVSVGGTIVMKKVITTHLHSRDISYGEKVLWRDLVHLELHIAMLEQEILFKKMDQQKEDNQFHIDDGYASW